MNTLARLLSVAVAVVPVACAETALSVVTQRSPCSSASQPDRADRKESSPYLVQLRKAVAAKWHPEVIPGFKDPAGPLFRSVDHRATLLLVTLDRTGALQDASVKESSGLELFDQVALDAMRKAQPFAPPPPSLLDARNEYRFPIGFCLERGSTRHDRAEMPSPVTARSAQVRALRVRAYADQEYRASVPDWRDRIASQVENASAVTLDEFRVRLDVESIRPWDRTIDTNGLERVLEQLVREDPAFDVDWVVGFVGPSPAPEKRPDSVGRAQHFSRHFVLRATDSVAPHTLFLHEWAHTLGAVHDCVGNWILSVPYRSMWSAFSPESAWLVRLGLDRRDVVGEASHREWVTAYGEAATRIEAASPACNVLQRELRSSHKLLFMASRAYLTFDFEAALPKDAAEQWASSAYAAINKRLDAFANAFKSSAAPLRRTDRITVVSVSVDASGKVVDAHVDLSSGFAPFDDVVVEALRAQRFPNLPPQFSKGDGRSEFLTSFRIEL